ncbi:hypothetical protein D3C77_671760 [compost metagenome]
MPAKIALKACERNIDIACLKRGYGICAVNLSNRNCDQRVVLLESLNQRRQHIDHGRCDRTDGQHAGVASYRFVYRQLESFQLIGKLSDCGKYGRPGSRQLCSTARPGEQLNALGLFEGLDLLG